MKHSTLLMLLLLSVNVLGQTDIKVDKAKKFQIGISVSPDICYRSLFNQEGDWQDDEIIKVRNASEIPNIGYHAGLSFGYKFKKWLGLEIGVQLSNNRYATKYIELHPLVPEPGLPEKVKTYYDKYYIDIPLKINFMAGNKKLHFFSGIGLSADLFIQENLLTIYKYNDGSTEKQRQKQLDLYKKMVLSAIAEAGMEYSISKRFSLRIVPVFRYNILNIINTPITSRLWSGGLNIGFYVGL
jgi:hypothetical protein